MKACPFFFFLLLSLSLLSSCKKEVCLKCTTTIIGVTKDYPELCDTDKDILNAQEEEYNALVADFVKDGWDASVNCVRR